MTQSTHQTVHIRVAGRSEELTLAALDVQADASDAQLKDAITRYLDLTTTQLAHHVIVRTSRAIIVRPEAIYG